jgi:hypothetical protein
MKALLLAFLFPVIALAQVDITGNLVNNTQTATATTSTWQNVVFDSSLQCWAPGGPGNCGPKPTYNTSTNTINFSYGFSDVYQKVNVSKALPYGGTGLVTTGFTFGWESKNGNGWDDGRLDQLSAYVKLYSSNDAKVLETFNWNLTYLHNWTTFTIDKTWSNTKLGYRENQLGNVQYGFIGMDNNYWAGTYGPEVTNITFQLKYKPDPCKNNPLFSPECPNFQQELAKATATPTTEKLDTPKQDDIFQESKDSPRDKTEQHFERDEIYEEGVDYNVEIALTKVFSAQVKQEERSAEIAREAVQQTERISEQTTKQAELIARDSQQRSIRDSEQSQIDSQTQQNKAQESVVSLFQGPTISSNDRAFRPPTALQQNLDVFHQKDIGQPEQQTKQTVVQQQQTQNILAAINKNNQEQQSLNLNTASTLQNSSVAVYNTSTIKIEDIFVQPVQNIEQQQLAVTLPKAILPNMQPLSEQTLTQQPVLQPSLPETKPIQIELQETPQLAVSFLTNRADPINQVLENKTVTTPEFKQETKIANVKQNVQENDAAVGISISNIAKTPVGFNSYLVALADAQFYSPKEIYRNQRTVDNQRALRQLSSDRLHQEMIELQYRSVR